MKTLPLILSFFILFSSIAVASEATVQISSVTLNNKECYNIESFTQSIINIKDSLGSVKKEKGIAVLLAITVGMLGVHRWYLGTTPVVFAAYIFTLGGAGVVWIIDIVKLLSEKEISPYTDNADFFMWRKTKKCLNLKSEM